LVGIRSVDDYELYFRTPGEAEEALAILQTALAVYGLALNQHKTRIENLPVPLEDTWPMKLRDLRMRRGPVAQISDLLAYFSNAFELAQQHPTASVLRFALSRVRRVPLHGTSWQTFQDLLFQCAVAEPGTLQYVLATLRRWQRLGHAVDADRFQETVAEIIGKHLPLAHGSEVAWALWASVALAIPLVKAVIKNLPRTTDPLVPILALHAESIGLAPGLNKARWQKLVVEDELYGPNWLLVYEGTQRNWLSPGPADPIKKHRAFKHLRSNKVSFYRSNASAEYIPPWRRSLGLPQLIGYGL